MGKKNYGSSMYFVKGVWGETPSFSQTHPWPLSLDRGELVFLLGLYAFSSKPCPTPFYLERRVGDEFHYRAFLKLTPCHILSREG
ncbi:MAG TPA: hypothetical protein VF941_18235 [Clostridia bacterium]